MAKGQTREPGAVLDLKNPPEHQNGYHHQDLQILSAILQTCRSPDSLGVVLDQVLSLLLSRHSLAIRSGASIVLYSGTTGELEMQAQRGHLVGHPGRRRVFSPDWHESGGLCWLPIRREEEVFGSLYLQASVEHRWSGTEKSFLTQVADMLADAIHRRSTTQALQMSEQRYRDIALCGGDWIWEVDCQGRYTHANETVFDVIGYRPEEIIGRTPFDLMPETERERVQAMFKGLVSDRQRIVALENWNLHKDGTLVCLLTNGVPILDEQGELTGYRGVDRDITERKRVEDELNISEHFNRSIIQNSRDCIAVLDSDARLQYMNDGGQALLEITDIAPYLGVGYDRFWSRERDRQASRLAISDALTGREGRFTGCAPTAKGTPKWWDVVVTPIYGEDRQVESLLTISRDMTERRMAEQALEESEQRLKQAQAYAHIGYWSLEADMETAFWSDEARQIVGRDDVFAPGPEFLKEIVHPNDLPFLLESLKRALTKGTEHSAQYRIRRPGGEERWLDCKGMPVFDENRKVVRLSGVFQDITARKLSEELLRRSLAEKEVLLGEIHHRVKNNLQVVAGLLTLQSKRSSGQETANALQESVRRIQLMADIHNRLYRSTDLANVQFDLFVRSLAQDALLSYGVDTASIRLDMQLNPIALPVDQAIPCSQIVSELLSNSIKHAFPGGASGCITIRLFTAGDRTIMVIEDDGIGVPEDFDWDRNESLGLRIVQALVKQLEGEIEILSPGGTGYRISF